MCLPFCPKCGKQIEENALCCRNCGEPLTQHSQPVQSPQPMQSSVSPYALPLPSKGAGGRKFSILGIVFACLSLIVLAIPFGMLAVIFGLLGVLKNDTKLGVVAIVLGVVLATISFLAALFFLY